MGLDVAMVWSVGLNAVSLSLRSPLHSVLLLLMDRSALEMGYVIQILWHVCVRRCLLLLGDE